MFQFEMPGPRHHGPLPPLTPRQATLQECLREHVETLAGDIGERNVWRPRALQDAANHIERTCRREGYSVGRQAYISEGRTCENLEAERPGEPHADELVIVGAHYDSVLGSPGADDNATGVAALLTLAGALTDAAPHRTIRFVAFANEEPPFFQTDEMGSLVYARRCRERGERVTAMLAMDGLGYYADTAGSQRYPLPLSLFYPSTGDFVGFVGDSGSKDLLQTVVTTFRSEVAFPAEGGVAPRVVPGAGWSDHWAFWQQGYVAIMVTDTLPFRYPRYHTPGDVTDQVDFDRLARVVDGLERVIRRLATVDAQG